MYEGLRQTWECVLRVQMRGLKDVSLLDWGDLQYLVKEVVFYFIKWGEGDKTWGLLCFKRGDLEVYEGWERVAWEYVLEG